MNDDPAAAAPTLIYSPGTCAFAELVLLQWLGLPHRLCRVTRDERKGERFRAAINPQGQVPVLLEDGDVLTENAAILLQLADRFPGSGMAPAAGTRERYELYRWLSWLDSGFHAAHSPWFAPQRFVDDPSLYETVRARALRQIAEQLAVLERQLAGREHVLLDRRNLLDGYVFAMARWSESLLDQQRDFPAVAGFLSAMRSDEGVRTALAVEAGELSSGGPLLGHLALDALIGPDGRRRAAP